MKNSPVFCGSATFFGGVSPKLGISGYLQVDLIENLAQFGAEPAPSGCNDSHAEQPIATESNELGDDGFVNRTTPTMTVFFLWVSLGIFNDLMAEESWRQLRGEQQGHAARSTKLVTQWSETENVIWKTALPGLGWSSPVIDGNEIWLTTSIDRERSLRALCIDKQSGDVRINVEVFKPKQLLEKHARNSHATPTPLLDEKCVYVHFGSYGTAALDRATGKIKWKNQDTVIDHQWGPGSSPVLIEDRIVVNCDGRDVRYVVALNTETGSQVWKTDRSAEITKGPFFEKSFSTPAVTTLSGRKMLLTAGANQLECLRADNGEQMWSYEFFGYAGVATPIVSGDLVLVASGYGDNSLTAVQWRDTAERKSGDVVWEIKRNVPIIPTPIVVGAELYMVSDDGIMSCVDSKSGKVYWRQRLKGAYAASIVYGDGKLFLSNDQGEVLVIAPSKEKLEILATNRLDSNIQATPAIVDNSLFIRTRDSLYRIGQ